MVPARGVNNGLDTLMHAQKRRVLPSESSKTHLGRRGKTSIILRISLAIFKITLFSSQNAFYDAIMQRKHHFYNNCSRRANWPMTYTTKHRIINIASSLPQAILILHEQILGENESFENILEPQHDECSPALENQ